MLFIHQWPPNVQERPDLSTELCGHILKWQLDIFPERFHMLLKLNTFKLNSCLHHNIYIHTQSYIQSTPPPSLIILVNGWQLFTQIAHARILELLLQAPPLHPIYHQALVMLFPKHITNLSPSVCGHHSCSSYHYPLTIAKFSYLVFPFLLQWLSPIHSVCSNEKDLFKAQMSSCLIFIFCTQNKSKLPPGDQDLCYLVPATSPGSFHMALLSLDPFQSVLAFQILTHTKLFTTFYLTAFPSFHCLVKPSST